MREGTLSKDVFFRVRLSIGNRKLFSMCIDRAGSGKGWWLGFHYGIYIVMTTFYRLAL